MCASTSSSGGWPRPRPSSVLALGDGSERSIGGGAAVVARTASTIDVVRAPPAPVSCRAGGGRIEALALRVALPLAVRSRARSSPRWRTTLRHRSVRVLVRRAAPPARPPPRRRPWILDAHNLDGMSRARCAPPGRGLSRVRGLRLARSRPSASRGATSGPRCRPCRRDVRLRPRRLLDARARHSRDNGSERRRPRPLPPVPPTRATARRRSSSASSTTGRTWTDSRGSAREVLPWIRARDRATSTSPWSGRAAARRAARRAAAVDVLGRVPIRVRTWHAPASSSSRSAPAAAHG